MQFDPNSELERKEHPMLDERGPPLTHTQLSQRLSLSIDAPISNGPYPTSKIQKGPVLVCGSTDLSGEGVGLGVPLAKFAHRVFFPGKARIIERLTDDQLRTWIVDYELNLEERLTLKSGRKIRSENFYALKECLRASIKHLVPRAASSNALAARFVVLGDLARLSNRRVPLEMYMCRAPSIAALECSA
jgi:hypothetical protein